VQASNLAQAGHMFFALTHSMNMHGRAAAMVTPIGDKKRLLRADSVVSSSGCAGRGSVKSRSSRKNKWKHARLLQGAQRREGVCVGLGCRGPECYFQYFFRCTPRDLGAIGDGAPPQAHIHLNLEVYISGSPRTKFGDFVTVCNRRFHMLDHLFGASLRGRSEF
jgi:5-carboxymethyl-2-hydroxymuconate isomerase